MTIEEYDEKVAEQGHRQVESGGFIFWWTGWKRKYDPSLMTSNDQDVPHDPIDDSLTGQWVAGSLPRSSSSRHFYASVPGSAGPLVDPKERFDVEVKPGQRAITVNSPEEMKATERANGLMRLLAEINRALESV